MKTVGPVYLAGLGLVVTASSIISGHSGGPESVFSKEAPPKLWWQRQQTSVVRFNLSAAEGAEAVAAWESIDSLGVDVWAHGHDFIDILVYANDLESTLDLLPSWVRTTKSYTTIVVDVASLVLESHPTTREEETHAIDASRHETAADWMLGVTVDDDLFFRDFQPLAVIIRWMRLLEGLFPSLVQVTSVGKSFEGREIAALKVSVPQEDGEPRRKTLVVTGGLHAREWISTTTVNYVAWSYITSYGKDGMVTKFLDGFDLIFIPVANPDGVEYTWEVDRLWRKSRQDIAGHHSCRGLDLDRSFGFEWDATSNEDACSETYSGTGPFQAVEAREIANWAKAEEGNGTNFAGLIDVHSYSQQILFPYSYSCSVDPPNLENLEELAMGLAKAIRLSSGETYAVNQACEAMISRRSRKCAEDAKSWPRIASSGGSAIDWFFHELRARYSYQIKLRDTGIYGFLLPPEFIVPTGREIFNAFKYLGDYLLGNNGIESVEAVLGEASNPSQDSGEL